MNKKSLIAGFILGACVGSFSNYFIQSVQEPKAEPEVVQLNRDSNSDTQEEFVLTIGFSPSRGFGEIGYDLILQSEYAKVIYYKEYDKENSKKVRFNRKEIGVLRTLLDEIDLEKLVNHVNLNPGSEAANHSFGISYKGKSVLVGGSVSLIDKNSENVKLLKLTKKIEEITGLELYID